LKESLKKPETAWKGKTYPAVSEFFQAFSVFNPVDASFTGAFGGEKTV
jgi:hypothetical protein